MEKLREERERILAEIRLLDSKITVSRNSHGTEDDELQSGPEGRLFVDLHPLNASHIPPRIRFLGNANYLHLVIWALLNFGRRM